MADGEMNILTQINQTKGSGIDLSSLVKNLVIAETAARRSTLQKELTSTETKISEIGLLNSKFNGVVSQLEVIQTSSDSNLESSNSLAVSLVPNDSTALTSFDSSLYVPSLAKGEIIKIELPEGTTASSAIGSGLFEIDFGEWTTATDGSSLEFQENGNSETIEYTNTDVALSTFVEDLNDIEGVSASYIDTGNGAALIVKSEPGAGNSIRMAITPSAEDSIISHISYDPENVSSDVAQKQVQAASEAHIVIDGVNVYRSSNVITDLLSGVEINLHTAVSEENAVKIKGEEDEAKLKDKISVLIGSINELKTYLSNLTQRGLYGKEAGPLAGDHKIQGIQRALNSLTTSPISGFGENQTYLSELGVKTNLDGQLSFDEDIFNRFLSVQSSANGKVQDILFRDKYFSSGNEISVSQFDNKYKPSAGTYSFEIASNSEGDYVMTIDGNNHTLNSDGNGGFQTSIFSGNLEGLKLKIQESDISDSSTGTIYVGLNFSDKLSNYLTELIGSKGELENHNDTYEKRKVEIDEEFDKIEDQEEQLTDRYNLQFGGMEATITKWKSTGIYLDNIMEMWRNQNK